MCSNWDTGILRRMYRSEEIMEGGASQPGGGQPVHPIHRLLEEHVARLNFTSQRKQKVSLLLRGRTFVAISSLAHRFLCPPGEVVVEIDHQHDQGG